MTIAFNQLQELNSLIARFAAEGDTETAISSIRLHRRTSAGMPLHSSYRPGFAIVGQGAKSLIVGNETYRYGGGDYVLSAVDIPVVSQVTEASAAVPYLCVSMAIDTMKISSLLNRVQIRHSETLPQVRGIAVSPVTPELLDATVRLLRLLDRPEDIAVLAPLIEEELLFRLLSGPDGVRLSNIVIAESQTHKIGKAVEWLREHYARPLRIEHLAEQVNMSVSSLHHHFKSFMAMTPVQYQKQLRLQEARRLMLIEKLDVGSAGHRVGYQSPSQFSREYARLYGTSPMRDIGDMRETLSV